MNINDYDKLIVDFRKDGDNQAKKKRIEYTESRGDEDVFANFKETANDINLDALDVLYTFMKKHWSSIVNYIKTGDVHSEPIEGRIMDLIQYLELTYGLIMERKLITEDDFKTDIKWVDPELKSDVPEDRLKQVINKDTIRESLEEMKKSDG